MDMVGSGISSYTVDLARLLDQHGADVTIIGGSHHTSIALDRDGVRIVFPAMARDRVPAWLRRRVDRSWPDLILLLTRAWEVRDAFDSWGPFDVVEYPDWMGEGLLLPLRAPTVCHIHGGRQEHAARVTSAPRRGLRPAFLLEALARRRATAITTPTGLAMTTASGGPLVRGRSAKRLPPPFAAPTAEGLRVRRSGRPTVLQVGALRSGKAPEVLLEACGLLTATIPEIRLWFIGRDDRTADDQSYVEVLTRRAAELGVDCQIFGVLPRREVESLIAESDVGVVASLWDTLSFTALESMALATPVVVTTSCGVSELFTFEEGVASIPPNDARALAGALETWLADPASAREAGRRAREAVLQLCDPEEVGRAHLELYAEVITSRQPRRRRRTS